MKNLRFISCLLVLLLTASCGSQSEIPVDTTEQSEQTEPSAETTSGEPTLDLPADLDYGGKTVTIHGWNAYDSVEFDTEEETGEIIGDAIYARNREVEEALNVDLVFLKDGGRSGDPAWEGRIKNSVNAQDGSYDIVAGHSQAIGRLVTAECMTSLLDYEYLDLTKPWWRSSLIDTANVSGNVFFCMGDLSPSSFTRFQGIFFNEKLIEDFNLENPYDLVLSGTWTTDKLMSMSKDVYADLDGNSKKDVNTDRFGFLIDNVQIQGAVAGVGLSTFKHDENGSPIINEALTSSEADTYLRKWIDFLHNTNDAACIDEDDFSQFHSGRALFWGSVASVASTSLRDMKDPFGFIPYPKMDENQENYFTNPSNTYSLWAIPVDALDKDMSAAVMEYLAYASHDTVRPITFEVAYKVKYNVSGSEKQSQVYDLMNNNIVFDLGRIMYGISSDLFYLIPSHIYQNRDTLASDYASIAPVVNAKLQSWLELIDD